MKLTIDMRMMNVLLLAGVVMLAGLSTASAEHADGKPGDDFRKAAQDYKMSAYRAETEAGRAQGDDVSRYRELSAVYREMAAIKHHAADLADQHRWNDIGWDRYHQLASQRDMLLGRLEWRNSSIQMKHRETPGGSDLEQAARRYEHQAQQARDNAAETEGMVRDIYMQLANVYQQMADIERKAAAVSAQGHHFDRAEYRKLERERDKLNSQLSHARR